MRRGCAGGFVVAVLAAAIPGAAPAWVAEPPAPPGAGGPRPAPAPARAGLRLLVARGGGRALGPTAYVHRPSSSMNPVAPLPHHNQDSTHISSDVATAAIELGRFGVEASAFHGREPDENRWDVDQGR